MTDLISRTNIIAFTEFCNAQSALNHSSVFDYKNIYTVKHWYLLSGETLLHMCLYTELVNFTDKQNYRGH